MASSAAPADEDCARDGTDPETPVTTRRAVPDTAPADSEPPATSAGEDFAKDGLDKELAAMRRAEGLDSKKLVTMHRALPHSTPAERQRFLADRHGDTDAAIEKLRNYLEWREANYDPDSAHLDSWTYATQLAIRKASWEKGAKVKVNVAAEAARLPRVIYVHQHEQTERDDKGEDVVVKKNYYQLMCGRLDLKLVDPPTYAHTTALYIDHVLDRNSLDKYTIVADLRAGHGWANVPALKNLHLVPFLQHQARLLQDLFPRRIEQIIVLPIPRMFAYGWDMIVPFLGTDTRKRVRLVSGMGVGKDSKPPKGLKKHMDEDLIDKMERTRESTFTR